MRDRGHPDAQLSAFLDDELDEASALRVTRHLTTCEQCMRELDELRDARDVLRGLPQVPPPPADDLLSEVPDVARQVGERRRVRSAATGLLVGLVGLLVLAFALGGTDEGDVVPPVDVVVVDHVVRTGGGPVIQPVDLDR